MNDKYDVKGRVRRLEQRKDWNLGLEHLPNRDSFDVEFSPTGQILRVTTYNMAGAVIVSEQFVYSVSNSTVPGDKPTATALFTKLRGVGS